ncbi:tetratricopeptide repeat protein, partial [bacterium]
MNDLLSPCGEGEEIDELVDAACTLAGGNPALLEQMVRIYLDSGVLEAHTADPTDIAAEDRFSIHPEKLAQVRLPLTVEDAVQARIAALAPTERTTLERAAAMGGVFWLGGLVSIDRLLSEATPDLWRVDHESDVDRIRAVLATLRERDYILRLPDSTFPSDEEYVFKHNLEREGLVRLTPPALARRYHQTIADWIGFKESAKSNEEYIAMLARHREKAGLKAQAAAAYLQAADVARSQYANATAVDYYARGLALFASTEQETPAPPAVASRRGPSHGASSQAGSHAASSGAFAAQGQFMSPSKVHYDGDADVRLRAFHHYGDVLQLLGRNDEALEMFRAMLALAFRLGLQGKGGAAHSRIGRLHRETGRLREAEEHLSAARALFEAAHDERG